VQQRISDFAKKEALPSLTRSGCAYLVQVILTNPGLALMEEACFIFSCSVCIFHKNASFSWGFLHQQC